MNIEKELISLIKKFKARLSKDDYKNAIEFAEHREWGVSYELLCEQLYEFEVDIEVDEYSEIKVLGKKMDIDEMYWNNLKQLIKK